MKKSYIEQLQELSSRLSSMSDEEVCDLFIGTESTDSEIALYSTLEHYLVSWSYSPSELSLGGSSNLEIDLSETTQNTFAKAG